MTILFANNAATILATAANLSDVILQLQAGGGSAFPSPGVGDSFFATLQDGALMEIVECTSRTGDNLTVVRGRDGTAAQSWGEGSSIDIRIPRAVLDAFTQEEYAEATYAKIGGPIVLNADPALATQAARKGYVDAALLVLETDLENQIAQAFRVVGEVLEYAGFELPPGYLWAAGQAVSRVGYSALFDATTRVLVANTTLGVSEITVTSGSTAGLNGMPISGAGIPASTIILSGQGGSVLTISQAGTASTNGVTMRVCPYGAGDGSTTFNVPDRRGTTAIGRDDMNGSIAGRVTSAGSGVEATRLGYIGGSQATQQHAHGVSDPGHQHSGTTVSAGLHTHTVQAMQQVGLNQIGSSGFQFTANQTITTTENGAHTHAFTTGSTGAAVTIQNYGTGGSQNMQPLTVMNFIIYTGV